MKIILIRLLRVVLYFLIMTMSSFKMNRVSFIWGRREQRLFDWLHFTRQSFWSILRIIRMSSLRLFGVWLLRIAFLWARIPKG